MAPRKPELSYRRRLLGVGALAAFALFVVGAPVFVNRIEDDLERRVPAELEAAGFGVVRATFSGQDGRLSCPAPLADPQAATDAAYDVWGVHSIELERSCRITTVSAGGAAENTSGPGGNTPDDTTDDTTDGTPAGSSADTTTAGTLADFAPGASDEATTSTPGAAAPEFGTLVEALDLDPQFSSLALLISESDISNELGAASSPPITIFAPSDEAFEDVASDTLANLRSEPEFRDRILRGHMVAGSLSFDDLTSGTLTALDGSELEVVNSGEVVTVDGATITGGPFTAANGNVFSVDRVLVPTDIVTEPAPVVPSPTDITFVDGTIVLSGVVASEAERVQLVNTALYGVGADSVVDQLRVDAETGLDAARASQLNQLLIALRVNLVSGSVGFDGESWYATGTYATETDRDAMLAAAESLDVVADLQPRPDATADDAAALEADINEFVAANPILFEPSGAILSPSADSVLDRIALTMRAVGGITIAVEGHTDSDGSAATNLALSQQRANAVRAALVERGVSDASLSAQGFGSEFPVLVDGVEDKAASRRVEFRIDVSP